ncbi:CLUMA_CG020353, isoform A [Clunio marinus]|uniref:CLUMA_CG020353, isoform A n=1 Tax=Clunio marinus TaxID=568069 RepID=A0A1J1J4P6_9DIPT|nr:CLUMA_CG020353, isoform A [Clunio marinus]
MTTQDTSTRRRVKLYALNAERQWDDRGTGHVTSNYVDRLKDSFSGISLLVRAENDGSLLLESKIQPDTAYQKQQDTLIVWSEGDNFDLALSFQEKAGCDEIWEKICQVQGKDPSVDTTQDLVEESEDERYDDMPDSAPPVELPPCEMSRLEDISEIISNSLNTQIRKEKLGVALEHENYIKKLLNLFHMCEDLENQEGLHYLFEIFKNIFLLNRTQLFEIMFADDTIFDVVGCLEYDPSGGPPKRHRHYLKQYSKFREPIEIKNPDLLAKIHQTYRVQYIQDIVLPAPSVFEDAMLNSLSSFIFFNKCEIVTLIQEDDKYLDDLFALLSDINTPLDKRRDSVLFLKEFCSYAQLLQPHAKEAFYKSLISLGILPALEIILNIPDSKIKSASIDILTTIVEYSPSLIRDYTLSQYNNQEDDQCLINIAIEQMLNDSEPELGGAVQLMGVIRILLDPETMLASANKSEKTDFLNFFYKNSIQILITPLLTNTAHERPANEDYHTVQLLGLILELLSFCVEHHSYHIKNCIISKDLLRRILVLMRSMHTFLVLCALRFLRKIISMKDDFYNRYITKGNLFAPVVEAFIRNNGRYNLLESAILELFEFIKLEDIKMLCTYVVENFGKIFDEIQYVQTFKTLRNKYDQHQDRLKDKEKGYDTMPSILRNSRFRRDQRQPPEEEEMWFNEEDDFEDVPADTKIVSDLDSSISKILDKKADLVNGPKPHLLQNSTNSAIQHQQQQQSMQTNVNSTNNNNNLVSSNSRKSAETVTSSLEERNDEKENSPKLQSETTMNSVNQDTKSDAVKALSAALGEEAEAEDEEEEETTKETKVTSLEESAVTDQKPSPPQQKQQEQQLASSSSDTENVDSSNNSGGEESKVEIEPTMSVSAEEESSVGVKKALVDYEGDDSDEEGDENNGDTEDAEEPQHKKARLE